MWGLVPAILVCTLLGLRPPFVFGVSYCPSIFTRAACVKSVAVSLSFPLTHCAGGVLHIVEAWKGHARAPQQEVV